MLHLTVRLQHTVISMLLILRPQHTQYLACADCQELSVQELESLQNKVFKDGRNVLL